MLPNNVWLGRCLRSAFIQALLGMSACADVLGLSPAVLAPSFCDDEKACPPDWSCRYGQCVSDECPAPGAKQCAGLTLLSCGRDGKWQDEQKCQTKCEEDRCVDAPSCELIRTCADQKSCCDSILVPAATFELAYAVPSRLGDEVGELQRTVTRRLRTFALDRFEVTIGRFQGFVADYASARQPPAGSGSHPGFPSSGWQEAWSALDGELPTTQNSLTQGLRAHKENLDLLGDTSLPVRGISWHLALAFCIWDGGRLPTEAEWAYAATGGEGREYPWPDQGNPAIDHERAVYSDADSERDGPDPVGTHSAGQGVFGHEDLAGNLLEWVADVYEETLPTRCAPSGDAAASEHECLQLDPTAQYRVLRGGAYFEQADKLRNRHRHYQSAPDATSYYGIRCARDVPEP